MNSSDLGARPASGAYPPVRAGTRASPLALVQTRGFLR
ncbi:MAG: hypothetical protein QOH05_2123, partial [Acetobacteraceae bacterium]|nr:hypothetical protein [Acetobacteraceae bacterium]